MAQLKTRFTVWMEPDVLLAAKARALQDGVTVSEALAAAAKRALIDTDREHTEAQTLAAVERVFNLIQRIDRRRVYDQQVLKEMVGLLVRTFFNHIAAVPPKQMEAAMTSGKARFNRFLDTLATNLRSSQSVLNDLPAPEAQKAESATAPAKPSVVPPPTVLSPASQPSDAPVTSPTLPPPTQTIAPAVESTPPVEPDRISPKAATAAADQKSPEPPSTAQKRKAWKLFG